MGTSSLPPGPSNKDPLIPTWLDKDPYLPKPNESENEKPKNTPQEESSARQSREQPIINPYKGGHRFRSPRTNFSKFARSGGVDQNAMRRAVRQYVKQGTGGSKNAVKKLGASRSAGVHILGFLTDTNQQGQKTALKTYKLDHLIGKPPQEVLCGILDNFNYGGTIDEAIPRTALVETVAELAEVGSLDLDNLTEEQIREFYKKFAARCIEQRIIQDIGRNVVKYPKTNENAITVEKELRSFIETCLEHIVDENLSDLSAIDKSNINEKVDKIYEAAFDILSMEDTK